MNSNNQFWKLRTALTEWLAKSQQISSTDIRIGIWGTQDSGKTTYLAMLYYALILAEEWEVTADRAARDFVQQHIDQIETGNFPPSTELTEIIPIFTYTLRWQQQDYTATVNKVVLNFIDAPGGFYERIHSTNVQIVKPPSQETNAETQLGQNQNNAIGIVDYLLSCDGIIFLLDPMRRKEQGDSYISLLFDLFQEFQERSRQEDMKTERLRQYMAFCVTKLDKEEIWSQGLEPAELAKDVMGVKLFKSLKTNFCQKGRYTFFSVASIGRYQDKDGNWKEAVIYPETTDNSNTSAPQAPPSSPNNLYSSGYDPHEALGGYDPDRTPENSNTSDDEFASQFQKPSPPEQPPTLKPTIKTDVEYEPFNVLKPVEWLIESIQKKPPSRRQRQ